MGAVAYQITSLTIVYSTVDSDADQRKHQSSASLAFVRGIHRGPVNLSHKWPVTRKMFPFDDVIMPISLDITPGTCSNNLLVTIATMTGSSASSGRPSSSSWSPSRSSSSSFSVASLSTRESFYMWRHKWRTNTWSCATRTNSTTPTNWISSVWLWVMIM